MADQKVEISEDDVVAFMDAKKVRLSCELCNATDWLIFPNAITANLRTEMLVCGNCGNIRHHVANIVKRWKTSKASS